MLLPPRESWHSHGRIMPRVPLRKSDFLEGNREKCTSSGRVGVEGGELHQRQCPGLDWTEYPATDWVHDWPSWRTALLADWLTDNYVTHSGKCVACNFKAAAVVKTATASVWSGDWEISMLNRKWMLPQEMWFVVFPLFCSFLFWLKFVCPATGEATFRTAAWRHGWHAAWQLTFHIDFLAAF